MRSFLLFVLLLITIENVFAQRRKRDPFREEAIIALTTGDLRSQNPFGLGFMGDADLKNLNKNFDLVGNFGLLVFPGAKNTVLNIPMTAGFRFNNNGFSAGVGFGWSLFSLGEKKRETTILFNPHVGYQLGNGRLMLTYNLTKGTGDWSYLGISYAFNL